MRTALQNLIKYLSKVSRHVCYLNMSIFGSIFIHLFNNSIITSSSQENSYLLRMRSTDISFHIVYGSSTQARKSTEKSEHNVVVDFCFNITHNIYV